jgi:hypothetical protein
VTPEETARRAKPAIVRLGAAFGSDPTFDKTAAQLGLSRWAFYFGARAGVLGRVDAEVVAAACGFFAPSLVTAAWDEALAAHDPTTIVAADVRLCLEWAREHFADAPTDLTRAAVLAERVVAAADATARPLFAGWRALPARADDPAGRLALALLRLREHRGASHLIAVAAEGLTPLEAILVDSGQPKAAANGWLPPYPQTVVARTRMLGADRRAGILAGRPYAALTEPERDDLVSTLEALHASVQPAAFA